jgi:hypothetical protein
MKRNLIAILLALTVMSWAQSTTPSQTPAPDQKTAPADTKPACACCDETASGDHSSMYKDMKACMHHDAKDRKEAMACYGGKDANHAACCGKDAKACSKDGKTMACCADGKCAEGCETACCSAKDGETASHGCGGGNSCGKHDHHQHAAPGN